MKLVVGLGNPGKEYQNTRHNVGFRIVDAITEKLGDLAKSDIKFLKPQTFMNNSGEAVRKERDYYKIANQDIIVIHDDVDLKEGVVKIVQGGSSAGHKGVQSIIDNIGSENFWRVRVGVGKSDIIPTEDWVLKNFEDKGVIAKIIDVTAEIIVETLSKSEGLTVHTYEIK